MAGSMQPLGCSNCGRRENHSEEAAEGLGGFVVFRGQAYHCRDAPAEAGPSRDAKREIELSVLELRDELEEEGLDEDDIDAQCDTLREALLYKARKG